jgi:hypothetical protein
MTAIREARNVQRSLLESMLLNVRKEEAQKCGI